MENVTSRDLLSYIVVFSVLDHVDTGIDPGYDMQFCDPSALIPNVSATLFNRNDAVVVEWLIDQLVELIDSSIDFNVRRGTMPSLFEQVAQSSAGEPC